MAKANKAPTDEATALALWAEASHDLRQPIQSLLLMAHLMALTNDADKRKQTSRSMEHALQSLQSMIGDLARLARIESGKITPALTEVAIDTCVQRAINQQRKFANEKALTVVAEVKHIVTTTDELLATELIAGLLHIAIALSTGGELKVATSRSAGTARVDIVYDGPSPTPQQLELTFNEPANTHAGDLPTWGLKMLRVLARQLKITLCFEPQSQGSQRIRAVLAP